MGSRHDPDASTTATTGQPHKVSTSCEEGGVSIKTHSRTTSWTDEPSLRPSQIRVLNKVLKRRGYRSPVVTELSLPYSMARRCDSFNGSERLGVEGGGFDPYYTEWDCPTLLISFYICFVRCPRVVIYPLVRSGEWPVKFYFTKICVHYVLNVLLVLLTMLGTVSDTTCGP